MSENYSFTLYCDWTPQKLTVFSPFSFLLYRKVGYLGNSLRKQRRDSIQRNTCNSEYKESIIYWIYRYWKYKVGLIYFVRFSVVNKHMILIYNNAYLILHFKKSCVTLLMASPMAIFININSSIVNCVCSKKYNKQQRVLHWYDLEVDAFYAWIWFRLIVFWCLHWCVHSWLDKLSFIS